MSKPFLITGHARSGTRYTATLLKKMDLDVEHENYREGGTISYRHLEQAEKFGVKLHQVRHPLKVLQSAGALDPKTQYNRCKQLTMRDPKLTKSLEMIMWTWVNWCVMADGVCEYRYKIEEFDEVYPKVFKILDIAPPKDLPDVPKDTNSWHHRDGYREKITWDMLYEINPTLAAQVQNLKEEYGYKD